MRYILLVALLMVVGWGLTNAAVEFQDFKDQIDIDLPVQENVPPTSTLITTIDENFDGVIQTKTKAVRIK